MPVRGIGSPRGRTRHVTVIHDMPVNRPGNRFVVQPVVEIRGDEDVNVYE